MYKSKSKVNIFVCVLSLLSHVRLFAAPWTGACQAPLSMGFSRPEHWSRLPFPSPGDLSDRGIQPAFLMSPALASGFFTTSATWEAPNFCRIKCVYSIIKCIYSIIK